MKLNGGVIHLKPEGNIKGRVLLSYTTLPFIAPHTINGHTNRWECKKIAELFLERNYAVDVIDFDNTHFIPKKNYDFCIDNHGNLERLSSFLGPKCIKIFHITTAHWLFQNTAEYSRLLDIQKKRNVTLTPKRVLPPSQNIEYADMATILGNDFTIGTYAYAHKPIHRIHISTTHTYPSPENKNIPEARKKFIWLGGAGMAHKGLDLVLEAFATMPDLELVVCGKKDPDFAEAYKKELFSTQNIHYAGHMNLGSKEFEQLAQHSIAVVFPSCSEGSSGGVVTALHAGLIPIISYQSGVDVNNFGIILNENTVAEIQKQVRYIADLSTQELQEKAVAAWRYAREHHTRERFTKEYTVFVEGAFKQKHRK